MANLLKRHDNQTAPHTRSNNKAATGAQTPGINIYLQDILRQASSVPYQAPHNDAREAANQVVPRTRCTLPADAYPLTAEFLTKLDDTYSGIDFRNFSQYADPLIAQEFQRINELLEYITVPSDNRASTDCLVQTIKAGGGIITPGTAQKLFMSIRDEVRALEGA